ncbi:MULTISPECIES: hypothetical protein [Yersinia]|uniref:hypothetical protein n=1 Tax=Yersinia TaxID=629 RepID=UPI001D04DEBC|nr:MULTISPECIES: hypothetical protein [Yersinia]
MLFYQKSHEQWFLHQQGFQAVRLNSGGTTSSFMIFLLSMWGLTYLKLGSHFWGSPVSYFGLGIAGIFFLIMHCRYGAKDVDIKNDGLAPMRELINIRRSGLTSPYLWLSRAGYLGFLIGMMH